MSKIRNYQMERKRRCHISKFHEIKSGLIYNTQLRYLYILSFGKWSNYS